MERVTHWIDGRSWSGSAERTGPIFDPSKGENVARVDFASDIVVDEAISSAKRTYTDWANLPVTKRASILFEFRHLLAQHTDDLARIITREHGKVISDAIGEVSRGLEVVDYACGITELLKGEFSENVSTGIDVTSSRQPLGVVAGITPFNFPAMVPLWMIPVAIACGNSFVLKPSEKDPSASVFLAKLLSDSGLPDGVLNVVHGDSSVVERIIASPSVDAVSFVGSTPVARQIYAKAAQVGKRVQALGGAKNHMVVLPDADMDQAADAAVSAAFGSAGERCMSISVLVAVAGCGDELLEKIKSRMETLRVGPGLDADSEMGPLVTKAHLDRVVSYLDIGEAEGAKILVDGRKMSIGGSSQGYWLGPCLLDAVSPDMRVYKDEIFGPVLSIVRVDTLQQAIELINANRYGNGAAIFTSNGSAARRFETSVDAGMVGVNVPIPVPIAPYSFGGRKESIFGDLNIYGAEGVRFYTRAKVVTSRWASGSAGKSSLSFPTSQT